MGIEMTGLQGMLDIELALTRHGAADPGLIAVVATELPS
jgi:hypothetical protein